MFLLALLYRLDASSPFNDGHVTPADFALACAVMLTHFPQEAAICADPAALRRALHLGR